MSATPTSKHSAGTFAIWALRVLAAALFLFAGFAKLSGQAMMVQEFARVGVGQWFRYFTGAMEIAGGVAALIPAFSPLGAVALLCVDAGAFVAQVSILHDDWIHTLVIGAALCALIYLQRGRLGELIGR
ncbi:MAG: DoxX family protein [Hyphomicrobiales bacterium]|nr:DoxX family protein [Hyphomicrobiales bacterium]